LVPFRVRASSSALGDAPHVLVLDLASISETVTTRSVEPAAAAAAAPDLDGSLLRNHSIETTAAITAHAANALAARPALSCEEVTPGVIITETEPLSSSSPRDSSARSTARFRSSPDSRETNTEGTRGFKSETDFAMGSKAPGSSSNTIAARAPACCALRTYTKGETKKKHGIPRVVSAARTGVWKDNAHDTARRIF
jgi:hypothetical protein